MITYTKQDIIRIAADELDWTLSDADRAVNATIDAMQTCLMQADPECRIELRNFGIFEIVQTPARDGARNPRTGDPVRIPARRKARFRPGKPLKKFLSQPMEEEVRA